METTVGRIRRRLEMTQAQLAGAIGVTPSAIAHMERGRRQPTVPQAWRILMLCRERRIACSLEALLPNPYTED